MEISRETKDFYEYILLPKNHWDCRIRGIPDLPYKKIVEDWVENIKENIEEGRGLFLYGPYGSGKSGIGAILLKAAAAHGIFGVWINYKDIHEITFKPEKHIFLRDKTVLDRVLEVDLLVVDEFFVKGNKQWSVEGLENIIRKRTQNMKSTVITSNANPLQLFDDPLSTGIFAVMEENFKTLEVKGANLRSVRKKDK